MSALASLPKWGVQIKEDDGVLHTRTLKSDGTPDEDEDFAPLDSTCVHFLRDVNAALRTNFQLSEFRYENACNECLDRTRRSP